MINNQGGTELEDAVSKKMDELGARWTAGSVPGAAIGAAVGAERTVLKGYGMADLDHERPNDEDSSFLVGSLAKQFTGACVAALVLEARVELSGTLSDWFPEFPAYASDIRLSDLAHHTSGIRNFDELLKFSGVQADDDSLAPTQILTLLCEQDALNFDPGTAYLYSNSNYFLLGQLVERATGQTLAQFAHARFFEPLGMKRTVFSDQAGTVVPGRATGYFAQPTGRYVRYNTDSAIVGASGLYSSVRDLATWARYLMDGEGGHSLFDVMARPGELRDGRAVSYGLGLKLGQWNGLRVAQHDGSRAGFRSHMMLLPDHGVGVFCLANVTTVPVLTITQAVLETTLASLSVAVTPMPADLPPTPFQPKPLADVHPVVGNWRLPETSMVIQMSRAADGSAIFVQPGAEVCLRLEGGVLRADSPAMVISDCGCTAAPCHLRVDLPGQALLFEYAPQTSSGSMEEDLERIPGTYVASALESRLIIEIEDGSLTLVVPFYQTLRWDGTGAWSGGKFRVERSDQGLILNSGRVRNLSLTRV